jgi:hypothetical protein
MFALGWVGSLKPRNDPQSPSSVAIRHCRSAGIGAAEVLKLGEPIPR